METLLVTFARRSKRRWPVQDPAYAHRARLLTKQRTERLANGDAAEWTAKRLELHVAASRQKPAANPERSRSNTPELPRAADEPALGAEDPRPPKKPKTLVENGSSKMRTPSRAAAGQAPRERAVSLTAPRPVPVPPRPVPASSASDKALEVRDGIGVPILGGAVSKQVPLPRQASDAPRPTSVAASAQVRPQAIKTGPPTPVFRFSPRVSKEATPSFLLPQMSPPSRLRASTPVTACKQVEEARSDLAALVLSIRPSLPALQLTSLLEQLGQVGITEASDITRLEQLDNRLLEPFFRQVSRDHHEVLAFFASLAKV